MKNYQVTIRNYSYYNSDKYRIVDSGDRVASIFDKLIEIAARKCDIYASDVFWSMKSFNECVEKRGHYDKILVFRETHVLSFNVSELGSCDLCTLRTLEKERCIWRLQHKLGLDEFNKVVQESVLTRVTLHIDVNQ